MLLDRDDGVEGLAGSVHADVVDERLLARLLHHPRHREDLGHRLDRDFRRDVAGGVDLSVGRHERNPEQVRVHLGQRRDVVGVLALVKVLVLLVRRIHDALVVGGALGDRA